MQSPIPSSAPKQPGHANFQPSNCKIHMQMQHNNPIQTPFDQKPSSINPVLAPESYSLNTSSQLPGLSLTPLGIIKLDTSQSSPNQSDQLRLSSRIRMPFSKLSKFLRLGRLLRLLMALLELFSLVLSNSIKIRKKVFVRA